MSKTERIISNLRDKGFDFNSMNDIVNHFKSQKERLDAAQCSKLRSAAFLLRLQGCINATEFKSLIDSANRHYDIACI